VEINSVSRYTATADLAELVEMYQIFKRVGKGAGSFYEIIDALHNRLRIAIMIIKIKMEQHHTMCPII
jgi:hypothetical protein